MGTATTQTFAGAGTFAMELPTDNGHTVTRITFLGRNTGSIAVNCWTTDGDAFEPLGTINLATNKSMITRDFPLRRLQFVDSGSGTFTVKVRQGGA